MTSTRREPLPKAYDPSSVEQRLYAWWESSGYFKATPNPNKRPFTIVMPPPNVTGELHIGHALTAAIEDALVRYHRMLGDESLWLPGTDHASIATQMVVERELAKGGLTRQELGREAFLERVWEWVNHYGDYIDNQHRRLGASCDWSRDSFTMDAGPSRAVRETFKRLYDKGLIYRGQRMINWDPQLQTVLSDLEVEHVETEGALYHIRYLLEDGRGHLTVATTRPETLLGDTAVAVNPHDTRFSTYWGRRVVLPVLGRTIPVVTDEAVAMDFGTGVLKITPAHDPHDYEVGKRHGLPEVNVLNPDGSMNDAAGPYTGMERFAARKAIVAQLEREGLLESVTPHVHAVGHSQRSGVPVEPMVSTQWFVDVAPMAKRARKAVESGAIEIVPERFKATYDSWLREIRDWCISRQLWWGHRIPVWYCDDCRHVTVAVDGADRCESCASSHISQDEDVLDTWFSSGLWPHSTLGWPDDTDDLRYFYPGSVMETGYDILFFWVARMVMLGLENMDDVPFQRVYLHGMVRDAYGQKMSKSRGNVIDPLEASDCYGTDALRFALGTGSAPGNDMRLSDDRLEAGRNFANKIWNAARFVLGVLEGGELTGWHDAPPREHREDRWILGRLDQVAAEVRESIEAFQLGEAQRTLHDFIWGDYCDWYIELAKVRMRAGDGAPKVVLAHVLERSLRLLHPFMPFVTEEVWQHLTAALPRESGAHESIMIAPYPAPSGVPVDAQALADISLVTAVVRAIRNVRAEFRVAPSQPLDARIEAPEAERDAIVGEADAVKQSASVGRLEFGASGPSQGSVKLVVQRTVVALSMAGIVDMAAETARLQAEADETARRVSSLEAQLANDEFVSKAPAEVVERERQRLEVGRARQARLGELLADLAS